MGKRASCTTAQGVLSRTKATVMGKRALRTTAQGVQLRTKIFNIKFL
jgi:hypothetical protein